MFSSIVTDDTIEKRVHLNRERQKFNEEKKEFYALRRKMKMQEKSEDIDEKKLKCLMEEATDIFQKVNNKMKLYNEQNEL